MARPAGDRRAIRDSSSSSASARGQRRPARRRSSSSCWTSSLFFLLVVLALALASRVAATPPAGSSSGITATMTTAHRQLLIRPFPASNKGPDTASSSADAIIARGCRNTQVGPRRYADERGLLCWAKDLDPLSGCCLREAEASNGGCPADECDADDACCSGYEPCVSCCMSPASGRDAKLASATPLAAEGVDGAVTGASPRAFSDAFDYCSAVCRTHRRSTSHENTYVGVRHHCFGRPHAVPLTAEPLPAGALEGVTVLLSAKGRSCAEACSAAAAVATPNNSATSLPTAIKALGQGAEHASSRTVCSADKLRALDGSCDFLRTVADCEAGCDDQGGRDGKGALGEAGQRRARRMAPTWPGYVDEEAAKSARPAMCVVNGGAGKAGASYDCAAKDKDVLRLCACVAP